MSTEEKHLKFLGFELVFWTHRAQSFEISVSKCGYFDGRPTFDLALVFITFILKMPWINKKWTDECDPPKYGIAIHGNNLWLYFGGKGNMNGGCRFKAWRIPYFSKEHYKTEVLGKKGEWIDITDRWRDPEKTKFFLEKIGTMSFKEDEGPSDEESLSDIHQYTWTDKYDDSKIPCKWRVERRTWRPYGFMWTSLFEERIKFLEIEFKNEVGSRKGTWKGGVLGTAFIINEDETPLDCLLRNEREKDW